MKKHELIWLAGLLEGEGCFFSAGGNCPGIRVNMTDEDTVKYVANLLNVVAHEGHTPAGKPAYHCSLFGKPAIDLMLKLYPYMKSRRRAKINEVVGLAAERPGKAMGSRHWRTRLNEADIRVIRDGHNRRGTKVVDLARQFGVSEAVVSCIVHRKTWRHVA